MARPNKKQHKIPRTYLQAFANEEGVVWIGDDKLNLFSQKPENILTEQDYYMIRFPSGGGTLVVETKYLNGIEGSYADIYREKIQNMQPITQKDKAKLAIFVASMMVRQPMLRDSWKQFFKDLEEHVKHLRSLPDKVKKQIASIPITSSGKGIPADHVLKMGKDVGSLHSALIPRLVPDIAPIIFEMKWGFVIRPQSADPFITSDNPCMMMNPITEVKFGKGTFGAAPGLAQKDVEVTLPLSSNIALVCGWRLETDCLYTTIDAKLVDNFNHRTKRHAQTIIGRDKEMLLKIIDTVRAHLSSK